MLINFLAEQPILFIAWLLAIVYGITVHEFAHAWSALWQGDNTAKLAGRVTLNPLAHVDLWGILMLVLVGFGWGKPTPVNQYNLKNGKISDNIVSFAGIFVNLVSVVIFMAIFKFAFPELNPVLVFLGEYQEINLMAFFFASLIALNLILAFFNLIPIPPLDGSHILFNWLPAKYDRFKASLAQNGPLILIGLIILDNFSQVNIFSRIYWFLLGIVNSFFV